MRTTATITFLLVAFIVFADEKPDWYYPQSIRFETFKGDTSFYALEDSKTKEIKENASIWRIRSGDILYDFYPMGNLQSVSVIKEVGSNTYMDTTKVERTTKVFEYNGVCKIYFDDSTKKIAAVGQYKNNKATGEWRFYDKLGRVIRWSHPMVLWIRSDYYDTIGKLIKQIDEIQGIDKIYTVREAEFVNGQEKIISNKSFFAKLCLNFELAIMCLILGSFFLRIPFNQLLYKREGISSVSLFWFPGSETSFSEVFAHQLEVFYTFWWKKVKPENRGLATISNILSIITLLSFFGIIIGLAVSGELK